MSESVIAVRYFYLVSIAISLAFSSTTNLSLQGFFVASIYPGDLAAQTHEREKNVTSQAGTFEWMVFACTDRQFHLFFAFVVFIFPFETK